MSHKKKKAINLRRILCLIGNNLELGWFWGGISREGQVCTRVLSMNKYSLVYHWNWPECCWLFQNEYNFCQTFFGKQKTAWVMIRQLSFCFDNIYTNDLEPFSYVLLKWSVRRPAYIWCSSWRLCVTLNYLYFSLFFICLV